MNHPQVLSRLRHKVTHGSRGSRASRVSGSTRHTVHDCSAFGPRAATSRSYSPSNRLAHVYNLSPRCYMAVDHCICLYKSQPALLRSSPTPVWSNTTPVCPKVRMIYRRLRLPRDAGGGVPSCSSSVKWFLLLGSAHGRLTLLAHQRCTWPGCVAFVQPR